jgi:general secretion pathway protein A
LEQLRLMSNWENRAEKLIQWVIVGQPELRERLQEPQWEHLRQRIVLSFHLQRLGREQVSRYIRHRLDIASGGEPKASFEEDAIQRVFEASGGAPRLINNICEASLLTSFAADRSVITADTVDAVVREMTSCGWSNDSKFADNSNYRKAG